jgi:hypothetical protein
MEQKPIVRVFLRLTWVLAALTFAGIVVSVVTLTMYVKDANSANKDIIIAVCNDKPTIQKSQFLMKEFTFHFFPLLGSRFLHFVDELFLGSCCSCLSLLPQLGLLETNGFDLRHVDGAPCFNGNQLFLGEAERKVWNGMALGEQKMLPRKRYKDNADGLKPLVNKNYVRFAELQKVDGFATNIYVIRKVI